MPRDRAATFEPRLAPKYLRRLPDFDEGRASARAVLLLYSRGLSTRDIQGHLRELYQTEVSPELISDVTDALVPLFQAWQARPLSSCYTVMFLGALFVEVRVDGRVETRPLYTALGPSLTARTRWPSVCRRSGCVRSRTRRCCSTNCSCVTLLASNPSWPVHRLPDPPVREVRLASNTALRICKVAGDVEQTARRDEAVSTLLFNPALMFTMRALPMLGV